MYKSVLKKIVPENVRDRQVIKDSLDVFVDYIFEYSNLAIDINNLYTSKNEVTFEEIIKTYAANFYNVVNDGAKNNRLAQALRKAHEKWGFTFDETKLSFTALELLTQEQLELFKSFQQSKGTFRSIEFIYKIIEQLGIESGVLETDGELVLKDFKDQPFHYQLEGSMLQEVFESFVKPLAHPVGWTYLYLRTYNLHFKDYFLCKEVYYPKTFRVYCRDRNIEDNFITNIGYLLQNDSEGKWLKDSNNEPMMYEANGRPVFGVTRFGTKFDTLTLESELYLVQTPEIESIEKESLKGNNRITITFKSGEILEQNSNPRSLILYYGKGPNDLNQKIKKDYTDFLQTCSLELNYETEIVSTISDLQKFQMDFGIASSVGNKVVIGAGNLFIGNSAWKIGDTHFNNNAGVSYLTRFSNRTLLTSDFRALYRINKNKQRRVFRKVTGVYKYDINADSLNLKNFTNAYASRYIWNSDKNQVYLDCLNDEGNQIDVDVILNTNGFSIVSDVKNIKPVIWDDRLLKTSLIDVKKNQLELSSEQSQTFKYVPIQENIDGRVFYTVNYPESLPLVTIDKNKRVNTINYVERADNGYKLISDIPLTNISTYSIDISSVKEVQEDSIIELAYPPLKVIDSYGKTVFTNTEYINNKFRVELKPGYYVIYSEDLKKVEINLRPDNGLIQEVRGIPVYFTNNSETLCEYELDLNRNLTIFRSNEAIKFTIFYADFSQLQNVEFGNEVFIPEVPQGKYLFKSDKPILNVFLNNRRQRVSLTKDDQGVYKFYTDTLGDYKVQILDDKAPQQFKTMNVNFTKDNNYTVEVDFKDKYILNYFYKSIRKINTTYKDYEGNYNFDKIILKAEGVTKNTQATIYYLENLKNFSTCVYFENRNIEESDYPIKIRLNNEEIEFYDSIESQVDTKDYLKLYFNQDLRNQSGVLDCLDIDNKSIENVTFNLEPVATLKKQNETTYEVDFTDLLLKSKELFENEIYEYQNPEYYNNYIGHFAINDYDFDNIFLRKNAETNADLFKLRRVGNCGIFASDEFKIDARFIRIPQFGEIAFTFSDTIKKIIDTFHESYTDYYENLNRLNPKKRPSQMLPTLSDGYNTLGDGAALFFMDDYLVPGSNTMRDVMPKLYPAYSNILSIAEEEYTYDFLNELVPLYTFKNNQQMLSHYKLNGNIFQETVTDKTNLIPIGIPRKSLKEINITKDAEIPGVPVVCYFNSGLCVMPEISLVNNKFNIKTTNKLNILYTTNFTKKTLTGPQTFNNEVPIIAFKDSEIFTGYIYENGNIKVDVDTNITIDYYLSSDFKTFNPIFKNTEYRYPFNDLIPLNTFKDNNQILSNYFMDSGSFDEITPTKDTVVPFGIPRDLTKTIQINKDAEIPGLPILVYDVNGFSLIPEITVNNNKFTIKTNKMLNIVYTETFSKRSFAGNYEFTNEYPALAFKNGTRFTGFILNNDKIKVETTSPEIIDYYIVKTYETFNPVFKETEDTPFERFHKELKQVRNYEKTLNLNEIKTKVYPKLEDYNTDGNN